MSTTVSYRLETILIKNLSLEIPENIVAPTFKEKPEVQLELRNKSRALSGGNHYEVSLEATARVKSGDDLQILIEIQQAGIFYLEEMENESRQQFLGIHAPTMLYPYLTYLIGDLMSQAGAPRVFLPPFNFAPVYEKKRQLLAQNDDDDSDKVPS